MAQLSNAVAYGLGITAVDRDDAAAREFAAFAQAADTAAAPAPALAPASASALASPWVWLGAAGVALAIYLVAGDDDGGEFSEWDEE